MAVKIKSDTRELEEIIENFQKFTKQTIPTLVRRHARLLAVELANRTQPFSVGKGGGKSAQSLGKNAVSNDLSKVFRSKSSLQSIVNETTNENIKKKLQSAINSGNNRQIGEIFKAVGMVKDFQLISKSGLTAKHRAHRSKNSGRTWTPPQDMFIATSGFPAYTKEIEKRVGMSKSAWAECAEYIGGVKGDPQRGIPAFAKNKDNKVKGVIIDGIKSSSPYITMTSKIPWASRILPDSEIKFAQHIVREKMIKQANMMTRAASKKNFNPDPIDE